MAYATRRYSAARVVEDEATALERYLCKYTVGAAWRRSERARVLADRFSAWFSCAGRKVKTARMWSAPNTYRPLISHAQDTGTIDALAVVLVREANLGAVSRGAPGSQCRVGRRAGARSPPPPLLVDPADYVEAAYPAATDGFDIDAFNVRRLTHPLVREQLAGASPRMMLTTGRYLAGQGRKGIAADLFRG